MPDNAPGLFGAEGPPVRVGLRLADDCWQMVVWLPATQTLECIPLAPLCEPVSQLLHDLADDTEAAIMLIEQLNDPTRAKVIEVVEFASIMSASLRLAELTEA